MGIRKLNKIKPVHYVLLCIVFFINTQLAIAQDTDGDGIPDTTDLDDDNDGILDARERVIKLSPSHWNLDNNTTKAILNPDGSNSIIGYSGGQSWQTSYYSDDLKATYNIGNDFEFSFRIDGGTTQPNFVWSVNHAGSNDGHTPNTLQYQTVIHGGLIWMYSYLNNTLTSLGYVAYNNHDKISIQKTGTTVTYKLNDVVVATSPDPASATGDFYVDSSFGGGGVAGGTYLIYDLELYSAELDTDNDGVANSSDLDSDNDGCPDAIEAATPTVLQNSGINASDGITDNTPNASINTTSDPVGTNGYANSLESNDTSSATTVDTFIETNYETYALDDSKNGCGTPIITQVYWKSTEKIIEVTNNDATKIVVPNAANINFFNAGITSSRTANWVNTSAITGGNSMLFSSGAVTAQINSGITPIVDVGITAFDATNDIVTLSRSGKAGSSIAWDSRYDVVSNFKDNTAYVRIDEILSPNNTYTATEWVEFKDNNLDPYRNLASGGPERHPQDPLLSEITSGVNTEANTLLGLHRFGTTTRTGNAWSNGYPDQSRHAIIDEDYNHSGSRFNANKITVNGSKKLSITDNLLVITNNVVLNGDIRLVGSSQLVQTHANSSLVSGTGSLLVDQNSTIPSLYRFNYMSSPVNTVGANTYTVENVFKDGTTPLNISGTVGTTIAKNINFLSGVYDGAATDPISLAEYWIYTYAPSANGRSSWVQKFKNGIIPQTDGFIFKGPGRAQNYTFVGTPKDGNLTSTIGKSQSYLVGNPFASALSVKKFIEDNINSITGTLYFWEHVGEDNASNGHNFAGYIGGYATRNIAMGLSANDPSIDKSVNLTLQAEEATTVVGTTTSGGTQQVVELKNSTNNYIKFSNIIKGVDTLKINYKSAVAKSIILKVDEYEKEYTLPAAASYTTFNIPKCISNGSELIITSNDNNLAYIDYILLQDGNGNRCSPKVSSGGSYNVPKGYISIGQGFFIVGDDTDGGSIVFNNSQREYKTEGTESIFFKSRIPQSKKSTLSILKLGMDFIHDSGTSIHRQLGISFHKSNSFAFDKGYDSEVYDLGSTDIYWKFPNDNLKYIIAGVQEISDDLEVPFDIVMNYNGSITLQIDEIKAINRDVFIKDKLNNQTYLLNNNTVALQLTKGTYSDRFVLAFKPSTTLSVDDTKLFNNIIKIHTNNNREIIINKSTEMNIKNVSLYNILGKKVRFWNLKEDKNTYTLNTKKLIPTGIYIVKLDTNKGLINKKLIIIK